MFTAVVTPVITHGAVGPRSYQILRLHVFLLVQLSQSPLDIPTPPSADCSLVNPPDHLGAAPGGTKQPLPGPTHFADRILWSTSSIEEL